VATLNDKYPIVLTPEDRQRVATLAVELPSASLKSRIARLFLYIDGMSESDLNKRKIAKLVRIEPVRLYRMIKFYQEKGLDSLLSSGDVFG